MKNCNNCSHLKKTKSNLYGASDNVCTEILAHIHVEISSGWNGHCIDHIEIEEPEDFGCTKHEEL